MVLFTLFLLIFKWKIDRCNSSDKVVTTSRILKCQATLQVAGSPMSLTTRCSTSKTARAPKTCNTARWLEVVPPGRREWPTRIKPKAPTTYQGAYHRISKAMAKCSKIAITTEITKRVIVSHILAQTTKAQPVLHPPTISR